MDSQPKISKATIFHFNDFHRRLDSFKDGTGGADKLVGKIRELESENPDAVTVNVGDVAGDNTPQGPDQFSPIPGLFNRAGVDILGLGNHEFEDPKGDYKSLREGLIKPFKGEVLAANVTMADGSPIEGTKPYTIRQLREHSVAFIGVVTRDLASAVFPAAGAGLATMPIEDTLLELIPKVKAEGADAVVVLGHDNLTNMQKVAKNVPGVDLVLAAHDHRATEKPIEVVRDDGSKAWVAEADAYGKSVGEVNLVFEDNKLVDVEGGLLQIDQSSPSDAEAKKIADAHKPAPKVKIPKKAKMETVSSFAELAERLFKEPE